MNKKRFARVLKVVLVTVVAGIMATMLFACGGSGSGTGSATDSSTSAGTTTDTSTQDQQSQQTQTASKGTIRLATTTSTKDSGLLDVILPDFTAKTGYDVDVISVGSGDAIQMGVDGEADVLLVHSPAAEKDFVAQGNADATGRLDVMYNDFVIIGPKSDPAKIKSTAGNDAVAAFTTLAKSQSMFISRGDNSGTNVKENDLWSKANITPQGDWYVVAGDGMGAVITMADERMAYTLADRATWLSMSQNTDLQIVCEKDPSGVLNNQYGVICVNPDKNPNINHDGAVAFQNWITSPDTQNLISQYGMDTYGQSLFIPNAK